MENTNQTGESKMNQVKIDGITYNLINRETPETHRQNGRHNTAKVFEENRIAAQLYLRRPRGRVLYCVNEYNEYNSTFYGSVFSLGR